MAFAIRKIVYRLLHTYTKRPQHTAHLKRTTQALYIVYFIEAADVLAITGTALCGALLLLALSLLINLAFAHNDFCVYIYNVWDFMRYNTHV